MPKIYVGTYAKYNAGSLKGKWLDLEDYSDYEDFQRACLKLHPDEDDPELMFQDFEEIPRGFVGEYWIDPELWNYMNSDIDDGVKTAFMYLFNAWDEDICNESYIGEFRNLTALAEHLVDEQGLLGDIPEIMQNYFDYAAYGRDLEFGGDVCEDNNHYFWKNH